jgi:anti-sigma factor RsiW
MMAWLDSELETRATVEVSEHLDTCEACRRRFDAEERLERGMAEMLRDERAPDEEWKRLTAALGDSHASRWRWVAVAASLLLALTVALRLTPHPNGLLAEMARSHRAVVAGEATLDIYTSEGERLRSFLSERRLDALAPELPGMVGHHAMELVGVREEHLLGQRGVSVALRPRCS